MRKIESIADETRGYVTYDVGNGMFVQFSIRDLQRYGLLELMREYKIAEPTERVPVMQRGRRIGTVPATFEPACVRSTTFLYDVRPGDFRREGDVWVASSSLGSGDLEAVEGFVWDSKR